jgi:hypothetical protein
MERAAQERAIKDAATPLMQARQHACLTNLRRRKKKKKMLPFPWYRGEVANEAGIT